ncbi:MAG: efflux RND transporter permease subunit [Endozoicomonadaceae bacterium]|nr:efflux RND transporter permease subunit [Endozoicomonadaceae bacterium]
MKFTDIFICRPILSLSLSLFIILFGLLFTSKISVREYPEVQYTKIVIDTFYYGADAELIQSVITQPLEEAVSQIDQIDYITSNSGFGYSHIEVIMKLNTNAHHALTEALTSINTIQHKLPKDAQTPIVTSDTQTVSSLLYIGFISDSMSSSQITDYLQRIVKPAMVTVPGMGKITLLGGSEFAMRIWLNPAKLALYGFSTDMILGVLQANSFQTALGNISNQLYTLKATANTQINTEEDLGQLIIKTDKDGSIVRLSDVAIVEFMTGREESRACANGKLTVVMSVDSASEANPLVLVQQVKKTLANLETNFPSSLKMDMLYDVSIAIESSIFEVLRTLLEGILIVILIIVLFLGSWRAASIPIVTIPLSLLGVVILMYMVGFSFNILTLLAMVLAIGLVVDDAIIVVENVDRYIEKGYTPFKAAVLGTREIALPVISMTLTLLAVYIPITMLNGATSFLFREFAFTVSGAVLISGFIALTLSPTMCAIFLKPKTSNSRFKQIVDRFLDKISNIYHQALLGVMSNRPVFVVLIAFIFIILPILIYFIPKELAPIEDRGAIMMIASGSENANLDHMEQEMKTIGNTLSSVKEVESTILFAGFPNKNQGFGVAKLELWDQRKTKINGMLGKLRHLLSDIPAVDVTPFAFPSLPGGVRGLPIQLVITTFQSFESLYEEAQKVLKLTKNPAYFLFSRIDLNFSSGQLSIQVDRDQLMHYGVSMRQITDTLSSMMNEKRVSQLNLNGKTYDILMQAERNQRFTPESLYDYYVKTNSGELVPIRNFVTFDFVSKPFSYNHFNQMNAATIGLVPTPGVPIGEAISFLKNLAETELSNDYQYAFLGNAKQYIEEGNTLLIAFLLALFFIFLVLACQFESFKDPLVILISVPLGVSGALVFMAWGLATMNIYTQLGLITLIGLLSKHGILMCEVAKHQQLNSLLSRDKAIIYAANARLRPILMTTFATIAGLLPLLFATGPGAVSRFHLGLVLIAGLSIGTIFTLFILPVVYSYIASIHKPLPNADF